MGDAEGDEPPMLRTNGELRRLLFRWEKGVVCRVVMGGYIDRGGAEVGRGTLEGRVGGCDVRGGLCEWKKGRRTRCASGDSCAAALRCR